MSRGDKYLAIESLSPVVSGVTNNYIITVLFQILKIIINHLT